jgi:putative transposase
LTEESYTSKTSFLDRELPHQQALYLGHRLKRGLFQAADGRFIQADVNGAYQIIRNVIPDAFEGILDVVVHPVRLPLTNAKNISLYF